MKFFAATTLLALCNTALAATSLTKRASVNDVAPVGYATLNGGTSGGSGGPTVTVTSLAALQSAATSTTKQIILVSGTITGAAVVSVSPNKSIIGKSGSSLVGVGLRVINSKNVIIRNMKISKVLAETGDAIGIQASSQVWVDHVDLSSDMSHDKDYYDGLLDITHGCTGITVTNSYLHDHFKASLIGHSDSNGSEDVAITVTYSGNYWKSLNSRTPSLRFGHLHVFNDYYVSNGDGINTRQKAQALVENSVWSGCKDAIYTVDDGFAVARGNDYGNATNTAPTGSFTSAPYQYSLLATSSVASSVTSNAGQKLSF